MLFTYTQVFTGNAIGALTHSFVQAVGSAYRWTYGDLLDNMRRIVREAQQQQGIDAPFASTMSQVSLISTTSLITVSL